MRIIVVSLLLYAVATGASAQSRTDWGGVYGGAGFNGQFRSDGDTKAIIDPGLDSRLTYLVLPQGRSYSAERLESSIAPVAFAGWRREFAGWIVGVEGQVQVGGPDVGFETGFGTPESLDSRNACGGTNVGCLQKTSDNVVADIEVKGLVSMRFAAGKRISDRVLLSAYVGPALAFGRLEILQTSIYGTYFFNPSCTRFCVSLPTAVTETRSSSEDDTALGGVGGVTADFRITDNIATRMDVGYYRFEALRGSIGGSTGGNSEVRGQSAGFSAGLGLSVQF